MTAGAGSGALRAAHTLREAVCDTHYHPHQHRLARTFTALALAARMPGLAAVPGTCPCLHLPDTTFLTEHLNTDTCYYHTQVCATAWQLPLPSLPPPTMDVLMPDDITAFLRYLLHPIVFILGLSAFRISSIARAILAFLL